MINVIKFLAESSFKDIKDFGDENSFKISLFIFESILNLSWFFKLPILFYLFFLHSLIIITRFKSIKKYTQNQKQFFYFNIFLRLPFSASLEKLIRTLGFMAIYDDYSNE